MTRRRGGNKGGAPATHEPQDEPASDTPAAPKPTMNCHLFQVEWTEEHFKTQNCSIIEFASDFMQKNYAHGLTVTRKNVVVYWTQLIWNLCGDGTSTCNRLESQADCPRFHEFCIKNGLLEDSRENDKEDTSYRPSGRKVLPSENKKWPGVLVIETDSHLINTTNDHREFLIPQIGLRALKYVVYKSLARLILEANPDKDITYSEMQLIWDAIIHKIYNFACACEKEAKAMESMAIDGYTLGEYDQLVREVRGAGKLSLGAKRQLAESSSEASDSNQSPSEQKKRRRGKRAHCMGPGPKSGASTSANAASRSASAQIMPPLKTPAAFAKPAVLPPSNVDSQEQTAGPGLGGAEFGQGRESGPGLGVMQMKRSGRGGSGVRGGLAGRGVLKSRR